MKFLRGFDIEVIKFTEGIHEIDFKIDDTFFDSFEDNELVKKGNLTTRVKLNKGANLLEMIFQIEGTVQLICDRSLEEFQHELVVEEEILYKYGSEEKEIDENIIMITRDTPKVNVAQLIYEFILLALPAKKIHPDYKNELDEIEDAEGQYVYVESQNSEEEKLTEENTELVDPRWEKLKNLKKKE